MVALPAQSPPDLVLCIIPAAVPHSTLVTNSQTTELAMLARKWLAPSTNHKTYVVENSVVHAALKRKSINLKTRK